MNAYAVIAANYTNSRQKLQPLGILIMIVVNKTLHYFFSQLISEHLLAYLL
jgi:hypothetical protein